MSLDRLLGRREALSAMAGRCTAAEVEQMREIRDRKLFLERAPDWPAFCLQELHMTKDKANRLIHYLDDFGPNYFLVAQLTRISPETYRAIAPSIRDEALYHEGQAIALIRENAEKVAAVVAELRRTVTLKAAFEAPPEDPLAVLQKECGEMAPRIEELIAKIRHKREDVRASICALRERLNRIEMTI